MFYLLFKHKKLFLKISLFEAIWMLLNMQIFQIWVRLWKISQKTLGRLSETLGRLLADFLRSLLMYFMLEDFPRSLREVFCPKWYKWMMSSGVQTYLCWGMISRSMCNSFIYGLLYDLYVYYFSCELFCKLEKMLIKRIWSICSSFFKSTWHYWSYWYNIPRIFFNHSTHS